LNELITPENFGGQTARNYPRYDLAFSALANLKFLIGRIWTTFGSFVGSLSDEKLALSALCARLYTVS
jgi:hypothetical protein